MELNTCLVVPSLIRSDRAHLARRCPNESLKLDIIFFFKLPLCGDNPFRLGLMPELIIEHFWLEVLTHIVKMPILCSNWLELMQRLQDCRLAGFILAY